MTRNEFMKLGLLGGIVAWVTPLLGRPSLARSTPDVLKNAQVLDLTGGNKVLVIRIGTENNPPSQDQIWQVFKQIDEQQLGVPFMIVDHDMEFMAIERAARVPL